MGILFLVASLICLWFPLRRLNLRKKCTTEIDAEVVDVRMTLTKVNNVYMHVPVCRYIYNGKEYIKKINWPEEDGTFMIGSLIKINICGDDPNLTYHRCENEGVMVILPLVACIVGIVIGIALMIIQFVLHII